MPEELNTGEYPKLEGTEKEKMDEFRKRLEKYHAEPSLEPEPSPHPEIGPEIAPEHQEKQVEEESSKERRIAALKFLNNYKKFNEERLREEDMGEQIEELNNALKSLEDPKKDIEPEEVFIEEIINARTSQLLKIYDERDLRKPVLKLAGADDRIIEYIATIIPNITGKDDRIATFQDYLMVVEQKAEKEGEKVAARELIEQIEKLKGGTAPEEKHVEAPPIEKTFEPFSMDTEKKPEEPEEKGREFVRAFEEGEEQKTKELAWGILSDPEVMKRNPREITKAFEDATGRDLIREKNEMAYDNLRKRNRRIIRGKEATEEAKKQIIEKEKRRIKDEELSRARVILLARVSEKTKRKKEYMISGGFDEDTYLSKHIEPIRERLGISADAFSRLVNEGYGVEDVKIRSQSVAWFLGPAIEIPIKNDKGDVRGSLNYETKDDFKRIEEQKQKDSVESRAQTTAELKIIEGKKRVLREKQACAGEIIKKAVEEHNKQQEQAELQRKEEQERKEAVQRKEESEKITKKKKPERKSSSKKLKRKSK